MKSLSWKKIIAEDFSQQHVQTSPSIFDAYDTIYFDLDGTIWNCMFNTGKEDGAYQLLPPFKRLSEREVKDINGNICILQEGVVGVLKFLTEQNINLAVVSRSYNTRWTFAAQPAVMLLKMFDIYQYFRYSMVIKYNITKSEYVKPKGKTLFIDDDDRQVDAMIAANISDVDVLRRKSFNSWNDLLPKQNPLALQ